MVAMRHLQVIVETGLNGRPIRELRLGLEAQEGGREDMRTRMPEAFEVGHLVAVVERLALGIWRGRRLIRLPLFVGHNLFYRR